MLPLTMQGDRASRRDLHVERSRRGAPRSVGHTALGRSRTWLIRLLTLVDQVFSGVSNVLAVVLVARVLSAPDFGRFALGYAMLTLTVSVSRSFFGTRVSLAHDHARARELTAALVASVAVVGPALIVVVFAISLAATGGQSLDILLVVACATPVVCAQDIVRFGAIASARPWVALASDGVWVAIMAVPFLVGTTMSAASTLVLWAGAAVAALVVALIGAHERPRLRSGIGELGRRNPVGESAAVGSVVVIVGSLWVLLIVSRVIGPAAAGSLRGAATAMGPVNVLLAFTVVGLTPTLVRRRRSHDIRFCGATAAVLAALTLMWGALLLVLPQWAGTAAFGASWRGIRTVLPWTVTEYTLTTIGAAAALGLRVRSRARHLMRMRVSAGAVAVVCGTAVAVVFREVQTVAATLAAAAFVSAVLGWRQLPRKTVEAGLEADMREHGLLPVQGA